MKQLRTYNGEQAAQARIGQVAVLVAYAVLRGTDLEDDVAATVQMSR